MVDDLDLVGRLSSQEHLRLEIALGSISPDAAKYRAASDKMSDYLSHLGEFQACARVQLACLETRVEFGLAKQHHVGELIQALENFDPINTHLLEGEVTRHDQLAVLAELERHVSPQTAALLHPGTTSYDILDTARSYLFKGAWNDVLRPTVVQTIEKLCELAQRSMDVLQTGRTHLQDTSPVPFGATFAGYAARLANRVEKCDTYFNDLRGKISGIVGTGASVEMVVGEGKALEFERRVLEKLGLKPDLTATQIVQKERLADAGHGIITLDLVLADFAGDVRLLYSSAIGELTSRDNAERLGGSSADATKNNPIKYENIAGKAAVIASGISILYAMVQTDLQRDLMGSVTARYQPHSIMTQTYESFTRANGALAQLSLNTDRIEKNLQAVRDKPSEAMVAILRGEGWVHSEYGVGHNFVKEIGKRAIREERRLFDVALEDGEFAQLYQGLEEEKKQILSGELEKYTGAAREKAQMNIEYARSVL